MDVTQIFPFLQNTRFTTVYNLCYLHIIHSYQDSGVSCLVCWLCLLTERKVYASFEYGIRRLYKERYGPTSCVIYNVKIKWCSGYMIWPHDYISMLNNSEYMFLYNI